MLISKINMYCAQSSACKKMSFKKNNKTQSSMLPGTEYTNNNCTYKGILTYKEILTLKELAENSKIGNYVPNIAVEIYPNSVADYIVATTQDELLKGKPIWIDVNDYDSV